MKRDQRQGQSALHKYNWTWKQIDRTENKQGDTSEYIKYKQIIQKIFIILFGFSSIFLIAPHFMFIVESFIYCDIGHLGQFDIHKW